MRQGVHSGEGTAEAAAPAPAVISIDALPVLFSILRHQGHAVVGPTARDGAIVLRAAEQPRYAPLGARPCDRAVRGTACPETTPNGGVCGTPASHRTPPKCTAARYAAAGRAATGSGSATSWARGTTRSADRPRGLRPVHHVVPRRHRHHQEGRRLAALRPNTDNETDRAGPGSER